jgi:hypothetical protein
MLYAHLIGGFPFWDPALLRIYRWGSLLSLAGLIFDLQAFVGPALFVGTLL